MLGVGVSSVGVGVAVGVGVGVSSGVGVMGVQRLYSDISSLVQQHGPL